MHRDYINECSDDHSPVNDIALYSGDTPIKRSNMDTYDLQSWVKFLEQNRDQNG